MNNSYKTEVIAPGDKASALAKEICFDSHNNCMAVNIVPHEPDNFRGPVGFVWKKHILKEMLKNKLEDSGEWVMLEEVENDGLGGKSQFFTLANDTKLFEGLGWDLITMVVDDFARSGRFPCVMDNEICIKRVTEDNFPLVEAVMKGYGKALREAGLVNITGETAIMKHSITAFCDNNSNSQLVLTWGASCIGLAHKDLLLNPKNIEPGMIIVGLKEKGYRCNGGTFFTNLIMRKYGPEIGEILNNQKAIEFASKLTVPSISYAKTLCPILGWYTDGSVGRPVADIVAIAHITGGGVWGKFGEMLPPGVGAFLDEMPAPPEVLLEAQEMSQEFPDLKLDDYQAYETFHGGCGMLAVVRKMKDAYKIIDEAAKDGIEAQIVGTTNSSGVLTIASKFLTAPKSGNLPSILQKDLKNKKVKA